MTQSRDKKHVVVDIGGYRLAKVRRSPGRRLTGRVTRKAITESVKDTQGDGNQTKKVDENFDILTVEDSETGEILSSVSSETALEILRKIHEEPKLPKNLADELDTTVQNVRYHLGNLEEAGLVNVGETRRSEKGREMSVYEPTELTPVLVFGKEGDESQRVRSVQQTPESESVLRSVHQTPRTPKEVSDELGIPLHRVEHHLKKLEDGKPPLVESREIHRRATVWSATEEGIDYLSDNKEKRVDV